jgi:hypothetical protein
MVGVSRQGRPAGLDRWECWALLAWGLAVLVVCARVLAAPHSHNVYPIFAAAGQRWLGGQGLYGQVSPPLDVFRYSPLAAALFAPISCLPESVADVLWRLLNAGALLAALCWWARVVFATALTPARRGQLGLLVLPLALGSLSNGQCNPLVIALVLAAVAAAGTKRWTLSAFLVALAATFKVYPLAAGLLLTAVYPRRLAARMMLAVAVAAVLPFALQGPDYVAGQYAGWMASVRSAPGEKALDDVRLRDLRLLCRAWQTPLRPEAFPVIEVVTALGLAGLVVAARRRGWPARRQLGLLTGLACCWMTVLGPSTESCTYLLLGPALVAALLPMAGPGRAGRAVPAVSYGLLVLSQAACWFPWEKSVGRLALQPLAALSFLGFLVLEALHGLGRGRGPATEPAVPVEILSGPLEESRDAA